MEEANESAMLNWANPVCYGTNPICFGTDRACDEQVNSILRIVSTLSNLLRVVCS